jgi:DNA-binding NarL/FixJ family response regulator
VNYKPKANHTDQRDAMASGSDTNSGQTSAAGPDPTLNLEESIVLRAFAAGKSDKQICQELRMVPTAVFEVIRDLEEKTGTCDRAALLVWVLRRKQSVDSRKAERNYGWRRPG